MEQVHEGVTGWIAYNSSNSEDIEKWILSVNHALPYLRNVLVNHKSYFPSVDTGLNQVEKLALSFVNKGCFFQNLFNSVKEERINDGLSDLHFAAILKELMHGPYPLLKSESPLPNFLRSSSNPKLELTSHGLRVLKGEQNRMDLVEIDWWIGGVHLHNGIGRFTK